MRRAPRMGRLGEPAAAVLASLGLHAAMLAALWPGAAPAPAPASPPAPTSSVLAVRLVPHATPAASSEAAAPALRAAPVGRPPDRPRPGGPSTGRPHAAKPPAAAPAALGAVNGASSAARGPAAPSPATAALPAESSGGPALAFHEQWDLDEPSQFLHVPASLAEAIESIEAGSAPVDAHVALFIDAHGRPVRVDARGLIEPEALARLSAALGEAWFAPGRLGGVPVASVKRFEWRVRTLGVRVIAAESVP